MEWWQTALFTAAISGLVGLIIKDLWGVWKKRNEKVSQQDELERHREIQMTLDPKIQEINENLKDINNTMKATAAGTVTLLRDRMKCSLEFCKRQGFKTSTDWSNWKELYNSYKGLGGNHFKEYVNSWYEEMENLPVHDKDRKE